MSEQRPHLKTLEELFAKRRPEYLWQLELPSWAPGAKETETDRRADSAAFLFEWEKCLCDEGQESNPRPFYDEGHGFFRFSDGRFALSRERADWPPLKETGFFSKWGT